MAVVSDNKEYINAGEFDQKIRLQEGVVAKDAKSNPVRDFITKYDVYAKVEEINATESVTNDNSKSKSVISVTTYSAPVTNRWRAVWRGQDYEIISVVQIRRTPFMKFEAIKV